MADDGPEKESRTQEEESDATTRKEMSLLGAGARLAVAVVLFVALGWWLDTKMGTSPWALIVCSMLGLVAGLYQFVRDALK